MPRPLSRTSRAAAAVFGLFLAALPAAAGEFGVPEPVWTVQESRLSAAGEGLLRVKVTLPPGYYQDAASPFFALEPEGPGVRVVDRTSSEPSLRDGKQSFRGGFELTRRYQVDPGSPAPRRWKAGWQICEINGVCLLPAERLIDAVPEGAPPATAGGPGFWAALVGALLGGLLLNVMPCVFPVLALKALGLAGSAARPLRERRSEALAFAAGSVSSLTALGLITGLLSALGQGVDWGFTFQQPWFVWGLALLFWLFCLQLWGLWSWNGSPFSVRAGVKPSLGGSFAGGALLVLAAAPCTAPLLGPALGFAFALPPAWVPLFFFAAGLGLALPLLILLALPSWARFLPRPGPWLVVVERASGLVLAATVAYLFWILSRQTSPDLVWPLLLLLTLVSAAWAAAGRWPGRRGLRWAAAAITLAAAWAILPLTARSDAVTGAPPVPGWEPYSPALLAEADARGQSVLVDATAAWCATCQVNEAAVLRRPDVRAELERLKIRTVVADYTRPDPAIRAWLRSVGRAGLPVTALYVPGRPVTLFPELLTDGNFTRRLAGLVGADPAVLDGPGPLR